MASAGHWRRYRPSRIEALSIAGTLVAILVYLGVLHVLDGRAETYFRDLRKNDPELYLAQLRESRSFAAYVGQYSTMRGYDTFQAAAPSFLVGRWTMRTEPLRLSPGTAPGHCVDPVTFDYGLLLVSEEHGGKRDVSYRIDGQSVIVKAADEGTFPVKLVSYGARLDHIEFQPPGMAETVYGYNCGR